MWKKSIGKYEDTFTLATKDPSSVFSFEAFLRYVANGSDGFPNKHWLPMYQICNPCLVQYDYITKLETIEDDFGIILEALDAESIGRFPSTNKHVETEAASESDDMPKTRKHSKYIERLQKAYKYVSKNTIKKLIKIYKWDFLMFNYDFVPFLENPYSVVVTYD